MSKKSFKNNPAMAFIQTHNDTQEVTHDNACIQGQEYAHDDTLDKAQEATQQKASRKGYIRTQGRKGHKKPRINLAFDSVEFLDHVRAQADREGKSITQLVNDTLALYIESMDK